MNNEVLDKICKELTRTLTEISKFQRQFYPPAIEEIKKDLLPVKEALEKERQRLCSSSLPEKWERAIDIFDAISRQVLEVIHRILGAPSGDFQQTVMQVMRSFRKIYQAQENLYSLRTFSSHLRTFFLEPGVHSRIEQLDSIPRIGVQAGLMHFGMKNDDYARGTMSLYVPESYNGSKPWPLVVALHGGYGHGRDFIWTWLREAKSRQFLLLAPTSIDTTWSILEPVKDGNALISMVDYVKQNWNIDMEHILATGISDGGTYSLVLSLQDHLPFTAYASVAGVLPPFDLKFAKDKRIYMVHGALDWMFPPQLAQQVFERLKLAGSHITFKMIEDLSHTYPREENDAILKWFDPRLEIMNRDV